MKTQALPLRFLIVFLSFVFLSFSSCKKDDANPKEVLPAATMEGKNTFGAKVNGKVWLPKGRTSFFQPNLDVLFDTGFEGGSISIRAYRVEENPDSHEFMVIFMTQVDGTGSYNLGNPQAGSVLFEREECVYEGNEGEVDGTLEITKLDLQNGIIAGKFDFTITHPSCGTVRVTEGRFDKKIF
ncbi:hypothetical protein H7F15_18380 [Pontibacter sp. Tf4]|uniref:DUF6252 family protein n=1 Tax=Pontibacter sp. Tf4 TaxID=2761620 RepID=UPI00162AE610|nr:DUF6252 family protein [Pontibacter sp. Tf4]MBB6613014.1 hypothetical protein [Pontibacter sp. Tf4]